VPEAEVLSLVWRQGSVTSRAAQQLLSERRVCAYWTVCRLLNLFVKKGLLVAERGDRSHVYRVLDAGQSDTPAPSYLLGSSAPLSPEHVSELRRHAEALLAFERVTPETGV
jgi:hypothetical protein